jgi:hypothetical protein
LIVRAKRVAADKDVWGQNERKLHKPEHILLRCDKRAIHHELQVDKWVYSPECFYS